MPRQTIVGRLDQAEQLPAIALKLELGAQQLQMLAQRWRPLAERIGVQIRYDPLVAALHVMRSISGTLW
jgi:hypothetical protein